MSDEVWESDTSGGRGGFLGCFAGGLGAVLAVVFVGVTITCCLCTFSWSAFVRFGIRTDLEEYRIDIRGSDLSEAEKADYIGRLEAVEDRLDAGDLDASFIEWVDVSADIEDVLEDGRVDSWEKPILEENIRKMERF